MNPPKEVEQLVERFDRNKEQYTSGNYNETQLRREFVDPFFYALGWDIENRQGIAEPYKDVIHEDAIKIGTATKAPDYSFRIGGTRKFFVEAKKPSVDLKDDISPAYQLRRYAWSAKLPLSILTDFEEFAIYDCRLKPLKTDKSSTARVNYLTYSEYVPQWEFITSIFSKDAVLKGSFDKYAETARGKKGTAEVDDAFLKEIESWRELLAKNIALRNAKLSQHELNFAVQRTIDRIIFLRICEDRGIELYGKLLGLVNGAKVYQRLTEQFYRADEKYNSGLFHFEQEKGRPEGADELTPKLHIDDKPLTEIMSKLYYPDCPYEFSVLPADILGQVYEQFLGKVIRLTAGHQAKVEDKPEVKKAGGVYYTPTYIVDYIVKNTVGKLLKPSPTEESLQNQTSSPPHSRGGDPEGVAKEHVGPVLTTPPPEEGARRAGNPLTTPNPPPNKSGGGVVVSGAQGKGKPLTPKEAARLRILDPACGSGSFLIGAYQYLLNWHRDWYANNDPEKYISGKNATLYKGPGGDWRLTTAERKRILLNNIYGVDIDSQAVEVTKLSLLLKVLEGESEQSINQQLKMFHERALPDLGNNIKCGNSLIGPDFYEGKQLSLLGDDEKNRINVFDWKKEFKEIMDGGGFDAVIGNPPYGASLSQEELTYLKKAFETSGEELDTYSLFMEEGIDLLSRGGAFGMIVPTGWYSGARFGKLRRFIATVTNPRKFVNLPYDVFDAWIDTTVFTTEKRDKKLEWPRKESAMVSMRTFPKRHRIKDADELDADLQSVDIVKWFAQGNDEFLTYADTAKTMLMQRIMTQGQPLGSVSDVQRGVTPFQLTKKPTHRSSRPAFNGTVRRYVLEKGEKRFIRFDDTLAEPKPEKYFLGPRLLLRELISRQFRLQGSMATDDFVTNKSMQSILPIDGGAKLSYILGIINSRLISWYFLGRSQVGQRDDFPKIVLKESRSLPIRMIDGADATDKSRHNRMVEMVEQMLDLHKKLPQAKTEQEKTVIQRQIDATDRQIDALVYELYGLTEEEIKIVEGAA